MQELIKEGMPEVGWEGDPNLWLEHDWYRNMWVITDHEFNPPDVVKEWPVRGLRDLDIRDICTWLAEAKVVRGVNPAEAVVKSGLARDERADEAFYQLTQEVGKEIAEAIRIDNE